MFSVSSGERKIEIAALRWSLSQNVCILRLEKTSSFPPQHVEEA